MRGAAHAARPLRLAFYVLTLTWLTGAVPRRTSRRPATTRSSSASAVLATLDAFGPALAAPGRAPADAFDLVCMNLCVLFVGARAVPAHRRRCSCTRRCSRRTRPTPKAGSPPTSCTPGEPRMGFVVNSRGFYDDESSRTRAASSPRSATRSPSAWCRTSSTSPPSPSARSAAPSTPIGVCAVGPEEYALLERDEALPLGTRRRARRPLRRQRHRRQPARARPFSRRHAPLARSPQHARLRAAAPARHPRARAAPTHRHGPAPPPAQRGPPARSCRATSSCATLPWLTDPPREPPSMSHDAFLELETRHAREICGGGDEPYYKRFWEILDEMRAAAAPQQARPSSSSPTSCRSRSRSGTTCRRARGHAARPRPRRSALLAAGLKAKGHSLPRPAAASCAPCRSAATACDICSTATIRT